MRLSISVLSVSSDRKAEIQKYYWNSSSSSSSKAKVSRIKAVMKWWTKCISMVIAKTASRNVAFKSDKLMDALFQEGQSAPQTPQTFFDADFEGLASNAEL